MKVMGNHCCIQHPFCISLFIRCLTKLLLMFWKLQQDPLLMRLQFRLGILTKIKGNEIKTNHFSQQGSKNLLLALKSIATYCICSFVCCCVISQETRRSRSAYASANVCVCVCRAVVMVPVVIGRNISTGLNIQQAI